MKVQLHEKRGADLLHDPRLNKGTAFTNEERDALGLRGLLPPRVTTQAMQVERVLGNIRRKPDDLEKYIFLVSLQERNQALFYRVVTSNLDEMMPLVYTPTVGQACQKYGAIFRRPKGLYISLEDRGRIKKILQNWPESDVRIIVVTDGERILGLGDLGAHGMGIPVGKLSLYTACAGVQPDQCLPVMLDVGTNNEALLGDPLYIGLTQRRLRGAGYDELVEEFFAAALEVFSKVCIQFEDFGNANAFRLLQRYRDRACTFNDDIQGTAAVTLAGIYSALRISGRRLADNTFLFFGAGEAGIGAANLVVEALRAEGVSDTAARAACWFMDSKGLVVRSRSDLAEHKIGFAHDSAPISDPFQAVDTIKPSVLIGVSGMPGTFSEPIVRLMASLNERPVIFALSNPTSRSECTAEQAYSWTDGRAIFAGGSPFPPVTIAGKTHHAGQCNNVYIFPGVGLGVILSAATRVTDEMFFAAAKTLAAQVTEGDIREGRIFPELRQIRKVSAAIASDVADVAFRRGLTKMARPDDVLAYVQSEMYEPDYPVYV
jgi:malate dehydrogenase (oxaloacetate-decarboxylating)(NADP+)